jgi:hypothetical protein
VQHMRSIGSWRGRGQGRRPLTARRESDWLGLISCAGTRLRWLPLFCVTEVGACVDAPLELRRCFFWWVFELAGELAHRTR